MSKFNVALALLLAGAAGGCTDHAPPTDLPDPAYDFTNNLDNGNPDLSRKTGLGWYRYDDDDEPLFAVVATSNIEMGCHVPYQIFTRHHVQDVRENPDDPDAAVVHRLIRTEGAFITVYEGNPSNCTELAAAKVAQGFGNFTLTDNDVFASLHDAANHNAFSAMAQGQLELVDGGAKVHFNLTQNCVWDGEDLATMKCHTSINLQ